MRFLLVGIKVFLPSIHTRTGQEDEERERPASVCPSPLLPSFLPFFLPFPLSFLDMALHPADREISFLSFFLCLFSQCQCLSPSPPPSQDLFSRERTTTSAHLLVLLLLSVALRRENSASFCCRVFGRRGRGGRGEARTATFIPSFRSAAAAAAEATTAVETTVQTASGVYRHQEGLLPPSPNPHSPPAQVSTVEIMARSRRGARADVVADFHLCPALKTQVGNGASPLGN